MCFSTCCNCDTNKGHTYILGYFRLYLLIYHYTCGVPGYGNITTCKFDSIELQNIWIKYWILKYCETIKNIAKLILQSHRAETNNRKTGHEVVEESEELCIIKAPETTLNNIEQSNSHYGTKWPGVFMHLIELTHEWIK